HLRPADASSGWVTDEDPPPLPSGLHERGVQLRDMLFRDGDVADVEVVPRRRLHDVVEARSVATQSLGVRPVDEVECVAQTASGQHAAVATGVPSASCANHVWSSNCDGSLRAKAMYDSTG